MDTAKSFAYSNLRHDEVFGQIHSLRGLTEEVIDSNKMLQTKKLQFEDVSNRLELLALEKFNFETMEQLSEWVQNHINLQTTEQQHAFTINEMLQNKTELKDSIKDQISFSLNYSTYISLEVEQLIRYVLDVELLAWKRSQQLAGIGLHSKNNQLDIIQQWCESLSEIMWFNFTQCKIMKDVVLSQYVLKYIEEWAMILNELNELMTNFTKLLKYLIISSFIIEKQPPQVMKTNTRFSTKVRLLTGGKLNIGEHPVMVDIITENQANILVTENTLKGNPCGEISNNSGSMEYDPSTSQLSITFSNMKLKRIERTEKKSLEKVVDAKFALLFSTKFSMNGEFDFSAWTTSLPVTVIVHGNQDSDAWATIIWDNAFALPDRKPFVVPQKVRWDKAAHALNLRFEAVTGKSLSQDNMLYLAEILFKVQLLNYDNMALSWWQFSREALPGRSFTFWDWFHATTKLVKDHLKPLWVDNTILGFIGKQKAEEILRSYPSGTFLLRFSDSELGGISIAWVEGTGNRKVVRMLHPFTAKDFAIRTLADRLNDLSHLEYLYPNIPKERAFGKYYTTFYDSQINGYVQPILVTRVLCYSPQMSPNLNSHSHIPTVNSMIHDRSSNDSVPVMDLFNMNFADIDDIDYADLLDTNIDLADIDIDFSML